MNEETLRKLNIIKSTYTDGAEFVADVIRDYQKLLEEKAFLEHPIFKDIVDNLVKLIDGSNAILLNDESLTDRQRDKIFAERRALKYLVEAFGVEVRDKSITALDDAIDTKVT